MIGIYCEEQITIGRYMKAKLLGVEIFKSNTVDKKLIGKDNIIMIVDRYDPKYEEEIYNIANRLNIEFWNVATGKILFAFGNKLVLKELKNPLIYYLQYVFWKRKCVTKKSVMVNRFINSTPRNPIIICSPPKTADITLNLTLDLYKSEVSYINLSHLPRLINKEKIKTKLGKIKIITGIREPISQNLSRMFQDISAGMNATDWILGDITMNKHEKKNIIKKCENLFIQNGEDVQLLWDNYIERYIYPTDLNDRMSIEPKCVQVFLKEFKNNIFDILEYPFDKEKGYAIVSEDNIEVFVYQLEKLNNVIPELSSFVGVVFDDLKNGNVAEDKWVGDAYKQAKKTITLSPEYFERCYKEPYVQHFYSEKDIAKFKEKWRENVIN